MADAMMIERSLAALIGFTLWVVNGSEPPYKRATFSTYADCVVAGQAEVDSMAQCSPAISWQCLPMLEDQDQQ
jgi:hypothetical protein